MDEASSSRPTAADDSRDALPTYEETIRTRISTKYTLKYPQLISRTMQISEAATARLAITKREKGLINPRVVFYDSAGKVVWECTRENNGLDLVFTRKLNRPPQQQQQLPQQQTQTQPLSSSSSAEYTCTDNKPAVDNRDYVHAENDDAPPAYSEFEQTSQKITLHSPSPSPYVFCFGFTSSLGEGKYKWARTQDVKGECVSETNPWVEYACTDRASNRIIAELVHYSRSESAPATLVVYGDLDQDLRMFLVVSVVPVIEEYPARQINYFNYL